VTPPSDFSVLTNFRKKRIAENRTHNQMWNQIKIKSNRTIL